VSEDVGDNAEEIEGAEVPENEEFQFQKVGEKLSTERKSQGLDLTAIAERTRVPIRHLEAIENSDFTTLPGATYTLGFARSYARTLGLDAASIGSELRSELTESGHSGHQAPSQSYEPTDPSRVPSKALAWTAAGIAAILLIAYLVWRSSVFDGGGSADDLVPAEEPEAGSVQGAGEDASAPVDPTGAVVLTANDTVWVRVYDEDNNRLYEKEMQKGDSFTVPADANNPMINTGRAQAIDVTIGGQKVATLGEADIPILDVGVSAAVLLARGKEDSEENAEPGAERQ